MSKFKIDLEKKVEEDIYKELKEEFTKYFEDFKKKEEEAESKNKKSDLWVSNNFPKKKDFQRGSNYQDVKKEYYQPLEFNRGGNFKLEDQPVRKVINQNSANDGWQRGAFAEKPKEKEKDDNWRGAKVEKPKEKEKDDNWRGSKVEKPKEKNDGQWERGANASKKNKKK